MSESAEISVSGAPTPPRARRTQDERTAETRTRVLDAAIDCLIDEGYAGTTTKRIAERTGISRGAQQHHFPKRHDLVIQAMTHLANRRLAELRADAQRLTDVEDRVERLLDLLQQSVTGPLFFASLELWVAARTDPALHEALFVAERELGRTIGELTAEVSQIAADDERFEDLVDLTIHLLRGMSLQRILREDDSRRRRHFELWKRIVLQTIEHPVAP
ncbi:MAG: TetR/AcrR family transcriptional regulator [Myxococcota bacterium]